MKDPGNEVRTSRAEGTTERLGLGYRRETFRGYLSFHPAIFLILHQSKSLFTAFLSLYTLDTIIAEPAR